jgi:2-iminobutanoate/2-iminopropanoate deaminase
VAERVTTHTAVCDDAADACTACGGTVGPRLSWNVPREMRLQERVKRFSMTRQAVSTENAPQAIGPYSQAIVANGFVFCSGTAGIDPATGIAPDDIDEQTELALRNLAAVLSAAGASLETLVKTTVFYANVDDFASINAIYARFMPDPPPARSAPANVALPRNLLISIDAIAVLPVG